MIVFVQRVWWAPHTWLLIPLRLNMNVVLDLQEEANGELIFTHQADHIFWVESLLEINPILTLWVGPAFMKYIRPIAGVLPIDSDIADMQPTCLSQTSHDVHNVSQCSK